MGVDETSQERREDTLEGEASRAVGAGPGHCVDAGDHRARGAVLVRELADAPPGGELLDPLTVKKRRRGYSPAQQILALCETLSAGGECLDDAALLRGD